MSLSMEEEMAQRLTEVKEKRRQEREKAEKDTPPFKVGNLVVADGPGWCGSEWVKDNSPAEVLWIRGSRQIKVRWKCGEVSNYALVVHLTNSWKLYECKCGSTEFETESEELASDHLKWIRRRHKCKRCGLIVPNDYYDS